MGKINDLKDAALATLNGKWGSFVGLTFIYLLLTSVASGFMQVGTLFTNGSLPFSFDFGYFYLALLLFSGVALVISLLLVPLEMGYVVAFLHSSRQNSPAEITDLFYGYKRFWHVLGTLILKGLAIAASMIPAFVLMFILIWSMDYGLGYSYSILSVCIFFLLYCLALIPAIILSLAYAMVSYILRDRPELSCADVLAQSRMMMKGHKWELFLLYLSFIGWIILSVFTLFIGLLWLAPYMQMTVTKFYEQLCAEKEVAADETVNPAVNESESVEFSVPETEEPETEATNAEEPAPAEDAEAASEVTE